jgi:hypothetical protein
MNIFSHTDSGLLTWTGLYMEIAGRLMAFIHLFYYSTIFLSASRSRCPMPVAVADEEMPPFKHGIYMNCFFSDTFWLAKPRKGRLGRGDDVPSGWVVPWVGCISVYRNILCFCVSTIFSFVHVCWDGGSETLYLAFMFDRSLQEREWVGRWGWYEMRGAKRMLHKIRWKDVFGLEPWIWV